MDVFMNAQALATSTGGVTFTFTIPNQPLETPIKHWHIIVTNTDNSNSVASVAVSTASVFANPDYGPDDAATTKLGSIAANTSKKITFENEPFVSIKFLVKSTAGTPTVRIQVRGVT